MIRLIYLGLVLCLYGCSTNPTNGTIVSVLWDITDKKITAPKTSNFAPFFKEKDIWNAAELSVTYITDVEYGEENTTRMEGQSSLHSNELERRKEYKDFISSMNVLLKKPGDSHKQYSVIFPAVVRELNRLSKVVNDRKVLLIYSDLLENTPSISFVRDASKLNKPDKAWEQLEKAYQKKLNDDLSGIDVYVVYQAQSLKDSNRFSKVAGMYQRQLEQVGARLIIKSNL